MCASDYIENCFLQASKKAPLDFLYANKAFSKEEVLEQFLLFIKRKLKFSIVKWELDSILYFAIVKNIEIIGEASYMLSLDFKDAHPDTNWKVIVAMRHFLVHGYYQVDPEEVWNVIEQDLQPLKEQVEKYLAEM